MSKIGAIFLASFCLFLVALLAAGAPLEVALGGLGGLYCLVWGIFLWDDE